VVKNFEINSMSLKFIIHKLRIELYLPQSSYNKVLIPGFSEKSTAFGNRDLKT
jgi:hypothetical protein